MNNKSRTYRFTALDTLFFRESRPMESIGGSELNSVFPPPSRTLAGALCTALAESQAGWDWRMMGKNFPNMGNTHKAVKNFIAGGVDDNELTLKGVWITRNNERIYPVPKHIVGSFSEGELEHLTSLELSDPQITDIGLDVRLPQLPKHWRDNANTYTKPRALDEYWLPQTQFEQLLQGFDLEGIKPFLLSKDAIYSTESRLGIAIDNKTRIVKEAQLFQTSHIRPKSFFNEDETAEVEIGFEIDTDLPDFADALSHFNVRTGGEGRICQVKQVEQPAKPITGISPDLAQENGIILCLLTPYCLTELDSSLQTKAWLPFDTGDFREENGSWVGKVNGVDLCVYAMSSGKVLREGGWNMEKRQPKPVRSYLPAGSMWYCTIEQDDIEGAVEKLHNTQIGQETKLGRGHIVVGRSPVNLTKLGAANA